MPHRSGCLVCGAELAYQAQFTRCACHVCGQEVETQVRCSRGHYVCDACHSGSSNQWIEQVCLHSPAVDPLGLAIELMHSPLMNMHGPEHHFLVPAVLLTTAYNSQGQPEKKSAALATARKRAENVLGGFCGFYGACGAGIGAGIFTSVFTGASPLSREEWRLANQMTARCLERIAERGGPRCCKRDTFLALETAAEFAASNLGVSLPLAQPIHCEFSPLNRECLKSACRFYSECTV
jgi:hypothetical protein